MATFCFTIKLKNRKNQYSYPRCQNCLTLNLRKYHIHGVIPGGQITKKIKDEDHLA